jgi:hypothetical protein
LPAPGYGAPRGYGAAYGQADEYTEAMQAPWGGGGCVGGEAAWAGSPWSCNWFAGANGLIMTRDGENHYFFSYDAADERDQLLDARQTEWGAGFEARFGRYYGCGRWAMEAAYWGLYPGAASAVVSDNDVVGSLDGILNWNQLNYNGASANVWVNDALCHRVVRDYQVHNIELNMLAFSPCASCDACCEPRMQANWVFGPRFFQFSDDLQFAADTEDRILCGDPEEIYYEIKVDNYLMGFQLGGQCKCLFAPRFRFETAAALGVYGNHMRQSSWIGGAAGTAVINNGPNAGLAFCVDSSKDDVAVLGEARVGLSCQFTRCWSGALGYRAVAVTGVALPTNQIYPDLRGIQDVAIVDSNGSLILHGCYAGVEFNY